MLKPKTGETEKQFIDRGAVELVTDGSADSPDAGVAMAKAVWGRHQATSIETCKSAKPVAVDEAFDRIRTHNAELMDRGMVPTAAHTRVACLSNGREGILKATGTIRSAALKPESLAAAAATRGIKWNGAYVDRVIPYWASDERVDRHGDIVEQSWKLDNYRQNSVVLYGHDWDMPPIGNSIAEDVITRSAEKYTGPALKMDLLFATAEQFDFAGVIFNLASAGFLKASSVGLFPGNVLDITDPEERVQRGLGRYGYVFQDNELIEQTIATIPANVGAHQASLAAMKSAGKLKPGDIQVIRDLIRVGTPRGRGDIEAFRMRDQSIRMAWRSLFPEVSVPDHTALDAPLLLQEITVRSGRGKGAGGENNRTDDESDRLQLRLESIERRLSTIDDRLESVAERVDEVHTAVELAERADDDESAGDAPTPLAAALEMAKSINGNLTAKR